MISKNTVQPAQITLKNILAGFLVTTIIFFLAHTTLDLPAFSQRPGMQHDGEEAGSNTFMYTNEIEPAVALTNGAPTLFVFYPLDACHARSCGDPVQIMGEIETQLDDGIDLVLVTTHAMPYTESRHHITPMPFDNWAVLPVEPYLNWLPQLTDTEFGWGLEKVELVLVAADGQTGTSISSVADLN